MIERIKIIRNDILSKNAESIIMDYIKRYNNITENLYSLREQIYQLESEQKDLYELIMSLRGVIFEFIPEEKKTKEIKNQINILLKGLENTRG